MLQLYRGERRFFQDVSVSPVMLVVSGLLFYSEIASFCPGWHLFIGLDLKSFSWQGRSLRFSGYQIAHTLIGKSKWFYLIRISYSVEWSSSLLSPSSSSSPWLPSTSANYHYRRHLIDICMYTFLSSRIFVLAYSYHGHRPHRWSYYRFPPQSLCPDTVGVLETICA